MKATVTYENRGFPIEIEIEGESSGELLERVDQFVGVLATRKFAKAPAAVTAGVTVQNGNSERTAAVAPTCPIHGDNMKASEKESGAFYCPRKNADGSYCKETA